MKRSYFIGLISLAVCSVSAQSPNGVEASVAGTGYDRMSLVKNSMNLTEWHEKTFWTLYEKYSNKIQEVSPLRYAVIDGLARTDKTVEAQEAFDKAQRMIYYRYGELAVWQQYYSEIAEAHNGIIALQFLQTETLLNMMETVRIYEESPKGNFYFYPKALQSTQSDKAKYTTMIKAISLAPEEEEAFLKVYKQYEEDCEAILGKNYSQFEYYAGDPSDFNHTVAKQLGNDLLLTMKREVKLKEKYFVEMNNAVGPSLAARFLAWEDYYSLVSKMYAWTYAP